MTLFFDSFQALPLMTVIVGKKSTELQKCRITTLSPTADHPHSIEFNLPNEGDPPLKPSSPSWANYMKGVIANFKGKYLNNSKILINFVGLIQTI